MACKTSQYLMQCIYHKYKENFVILRSIGIIVIKSEGKGLSPTPAGILVGI